MLIEALTLSASMLAGGVRQDTLMIAGRRAVVWLPASTLDAGRHAVVLFSHGLGGCPTQSTFMTAGLARHGYVVIAPFHRDAGCAPVGASAAARARPPIPFSQPQRWNDLVYADRVADIHAIAAALSTSVLRDEVDVDRIAVAGHSLGGFTAIALGGGWTLSKLPGIKAILALAPYTTPFLAHGTLPELTTPIMFQTGLLDEATTAALSKRGGVFDETGGPKYLVAFTRARHTSWGNRANASQAAMLAYALAFLDRYVRGASTDAVLTRKVDGVADLRWDTRGRVAQSPRE